ncbi:zinc finger MYM-type protein 1-like isoform X3 [Gordionus sp. m RMFG-2023]|uniref:zinc finger MYM-type protein 1-like isoform X3 n=1 Tax=Gordionus sp. m RMFG-2023 TaxID=3053472 RepID=UPI0031FE13E2
MERHTTSPVHADCEYAHMAWISRGRIDDHILFNREEIITQNRYIIHNIIDAIVYLIRGNIAFWGSNSHDGNFSRLITLISKNVPVLRAYLEKNSSLQGKSGNKILRPQINFISYGHVKKLAKIIKIKILNEIIKQIISNCAFSLILDGTYDISKKECVALIIRYIQEYPHPHPVERIINIFTTSDTTGENIKNNVLTKLKALHLPLEYLIGQSMDGASNMRGVNKEVQALIFKEAPKAIYVWCHAHRLNLIVIRICGYGNEIKKTMGILDELYNFMNGVKRQGVFTKFQMQKTKKSLKRIKNTTRNWASSFKALQNFLDVYEYIIASLTELSNSDDAITFSISEGLLSRIKRYDFILGLFILRIILKCTHETCIEMQAIGNDLAMMIKLIQHTKNKFQRLRANGDNILTSLHTDVKSFMDKNNVTTDIYNIKSIFKLDQKEFDNYIEQQKEKFMKNFYFYSCGISR